jgi:hypothetical protein
MTLTFECEQVFFHFEGLASSTQYARAINTAAKKAAGPNPN